MFDVLDNPRVQELLLQAEEAVGLLGGGDDAELREALTAIYGDLGKLVHGLARQRKPEILRVPDDPDDDPDLDDGPGMSTTFDPDAVETSLADFTDEDDYTAIPGPDELMRHAADLDDGEPVETMSLRELSRIMGEQGRFWERDLSELLSLLTPPEDLVDPDVMPEEASKVQWASGELAGRLADTPDAVQTAVLGMLAARARNVAAHLDVDIGPRMAIERLRRYREHQDLPWVAGLLPNARPEGRTWAEDAGSFWELLRPV